MRLSLTLLMTLLAAVTFGTPTFKKLNELNKCWAEQRDVSAIPYNRLSASSETEWIQLHLSLVEQTLRGRNTSGLTPQQKANRLKALDHLNEYWRAAAFPQNEEFSYRLPIFIDKYDNFCAVGYLVKATGYEAISRKIQAQTNYAYVRDMRYPELFAWADEFGFTVDELAWIQPGYNPNYCLLKPMGKATNGVVNELFVDTALQRLYVGGEFTTVDSAISANNIGYLTETNNVYTWSALGNGLNGPVHAIAKYNNQVFAAGAFTASGATSLNNVAYWNGSAWQNAGCLNGTVKDLLVYQGDLYAAGQFTVCPSSTNVNFAKWTGSAWQGIPGLTGKVNTMEVKGVDLLLGGAFSYNGNGANAIKWTVAGGFQEFSNTIRNEVNDFEIFKDTIYAVCKHTSLTDTTLLKKLYGNTWDSSASAKYSFKKELTYNSACVLGDTFMVGGDFYHFPMMGTVTSNAFSVTLLPYAPTNWFLTDSTINKMVVFKNRIIVGGAFTYTGSIGGSATGAGIAVRKSMFPPFTLNAIAYPKEACKGADGAVSVGAGGAYGPYSYKWSTGDSTSTISNLAPGVYTVIVTDFYNLLKDTVTVTITQTSFNKTLVVSNNALFAAGGYDHYQWYDCDNQELLAADTLVTLVAPKTGNYAVILTKNGCTDTSNCYAVTVTTGVSNVNRDKVRVYPNPVNDELTVSLGSIAADVSVNIIDITGRTLVEQQYSNTNTIKVNTSALAKGVYILSLKERNGKSMQYKLVKD